MRSLPHLYVLPFVLTAAGLVTFEVRAEIRPTFSVRELVLHASVIVRAEPADPFPQVRSETTAPEKAAVLFRVVEVLKGEAIQPGATIEARGLQGYRLGPVFSQGDEPVKLPVVKQSLLFLSPARNAGTAGDVFYVITSGIRLLTAEKKVMLPYQIINPSDYHFVPDHRVNWRELVQNVKAEVIQVASVLALREIEDPARRNEAIFAWIAEHWRLFIKGTAGEQAEYEWRSEPAVLDLQRDKDAAAPSS